MRSTAIAIDVNGQEQEALVRPATTLLALLRDQLGLTAAKRGCEQGGCGACCVLLDGKPVMSCLVPAMAVDGRSVRTLEGLAHGEELHPVQEAFLEEWATQCGFCTSGMIMTALALLEERPDPSRDEVVRALSGNVCRCTGYEAIIDAVMAAAGRMQAPMRQAAE
ncbi:(2Fe-2S)-binding protein [Geminicoccus roseus]|uniref:(2Fe-2S)-binding protein n=1 Tax=Geminicoccus roseus TaxID=404900 RepID=UPI00040661F4|nr:(2Fe-2S)-binding protein [Geminicoccus roseus]